MPPLVQVTPAEDQAELDASLAEHEWSKEAETVVLAAPASTVAGPAEDVETVGLDAWVEAWRATRAARALEPAAAEVLTRIDAPTAALVAHRDGALAGVALAVLQPTATIVFSVAVAPEHRRRGVATDLMRAWATAAGDRTLFLQTFEDNAAAIALYARLGFTPSHRYHYRRKP
jgi:N-acetylglutamate synthase